jgi:hypothetical protein
MLILISFTVQKQYSYRLSGRHRTHACSLLVFFLSAQRSVRQKLELKPFLLKIVQCSGSETGTRFPAAPPPHLSSPLSYVKKLKRCWVRKTVLTFGNLLASSLAYTQLKQREHTVKFFSFLKIFDFIMYRKEHRYEQKC